MTRTAIYTVTCDVPACEVTTDTTNTPNPQDWTVIEGEADQHGYRPRLDICPTHNPLLVTP